MTSADNMINVQALTLLLNEFSAMRRENVEFRREIRQEMKDFKAEVNARFDAVDKRFDRLEAQVGVMQNDITGLKHDVAGLYHWDYWLLSLIIAVIAMPQIVVGVKSLFGAVAEGISAILSAIRGNKS